MVSCGFADFWACVRNTTAISKPKPHIWNHGPRSLLSHPLAGSPVIYMWSARGGDLCFRSKDSSRYSLHSVLRSKARVSPLLGGPGRVRSRPDDGRLDPPRVPLGTVGVPTWNQLTTTLPRVMTSPSVQKGGCKSRMAFDARD